MPRPDARAGRHGGMAALYLWMALVPAALAQPATDPAPPALPQDLVDPVDAAAALPLLGRPVIDAAGANAGRVVDVLVDPSGQVRAVIVDLGGFMGLGQRRIAVAWLALRVSKDSVTLLLPADKITALPEYRPSGPPVVVTPPKP